LTPCGHRMVAVVCFTGSKGTTAHNSRPAIPATTAISLGIRCDRSSPSWGTRVDRKRRDTDPVDGRSGIGETTGFGIALDRVALHFDSGMNGLLDTCLKGCRK